MGITAIPHCPLPHPLLPLYPPSPLPSISSLLPSPHSFSQPPSPRLLFSKTRLKKKTLKPFGPMIFCVLTMECGKFPRRVFFRFWRELPTSHPLLLPQHPLHSPFFPLPSLNSFLLPSHMALLPSLSRLPFSCPPSFFLTHILHLVLRILFFILSLHHFPFHTCN